MFNKIEFLEVLYENAKAHNYEADNYYDLLNTTIKMTDLDKIVDIEFSKDNIDSALTALIGEEEITYHIIHLYHYFSKDNPVFQRQMVKYLERTLRKKTKEAD